MPTTPTYKLPYPSLSSPNNPPYDFQQLAEKTEAIIAERDIKANENQALISGQWYRISGQVEAPSFSWAISGGSTEGNGKKTIYAATAYILLPYTPPPGYTFDWSCGASSGWTFVATAGIHSTSNQGVRIIQVFNDDVKALTKLTWRLVKVS